MAVDLRASSYGFRVSLKVTLSLISPCIAIYIFQYIFFSFFAVVFFPVLVFRRFLQFLLTTTHFRQAQAHSQVLLRKLVFYTIFLVFVFLYESILFLCQNIFVVVVVDAVGTLF